jgi:hypothetical protein
MKHMTRDFAARADHRARCAIPARSLAGQIGALAGLRRTAIDSEVGRGRKPETLSHQKIFPSISTIDNLDNNWDKDHIMPTDSQKYLSTRGGDYDVRFPQTRR